MFIIGDIHGSYITLLALYDKLKQIDNKCEIYSVGDLIDRGRFSHKVIDFVIKNRIKPVLGNHELMYLIYKNPIKYSYILEALERNVNIKELYESNGGLTTIDAYKNQIELENKHITFLEKLPLYYNINKFSKNILITHAGLLSFQTLKNDFAYAFKTFLWNRNEEMLNRNFFQIFGHTPHDKVKIFKDKESKKVYAINIDSAAAKKLALSAIYLKNDGYEVIRQLYLDF